MNRTSYSLAIMFFLLVGTNIRIGTSRTLNYLPASLQSNIDWTVIKPEGEEFAASMPELPIVYSRWTTYSDFMYSLVKKGNSRAYGASADGVVYVIMSFKGYSRDKGKPDKIIQAFNEGFKKDFSGSSGKSKVSTTFDRDVSFNNFTGKQYLVSIHGVAGILRGYVTKDHVYLVEAIGGDETNLSIQRFFSSFALGHQAIATKDDISTPASQPVQHNQDTDRIFNISEVDRKPLIVLRREAQYTDQARRAGVRGIIVVKAVLTASGKVTNVEIIKGLPHGLSESAVAATREMKFIPAVKDGKPVSQYIQMEYSFELY